MPDIKRKPKMDAPKARPTNATPKDAAAILERHYSEQQEKRRPKEKGAVRYATDRVETNEKRGALLASGGTRRALRQANRREHERTAEPNKENAPPAQESAQAETLHHAAHPSTQTPKARYNDVADVTPTTPRPQEQRRQQIVRATEAAKKPVPVKPTFALKERSAATQRAASSATPTVRVKRMIEQKQRQQAAQRAMEAAQTTTTRTVQATARAAQFIARSVKSAASAIPAFGGAVLVVLTVFTALIPAVAASPFGILFANESASADAVPLAAAVAQVNRDFSEQLEDLQGADSYDNITVEGTTADWTEVLAVFAAKVAGADDGTDVATLDADRIERLKAVFCDMNDLTTEVETIDHPDSDLSDGDDSWTERNLIITLTPKTAADMPGVYGFTARQTDAMNELLAERAMLTELVGSLTAYSAEAADIENRLPDDLSPERREVVCVACSLVGKVTYFWGGCALFLDNLRRNTQ